jgi:hypothetical protein
MRYLVAAALIVVAGCEAGDPETVRMEAGSRAMLVIHNPEYETVLLERASDGIRWGLPPGTRVTVVDDRDDPEHGWRTRDVRVHVDEGARAGASGVVTRWDLHPLR